MLIRVCIIDDEPDAQSVLLNLIARSTLKFDLLGMANSFETGKELLKRTTADLVLLDINLGTKSGLDLAKTIDTSKTTIVFTTAHDKYVLDALRLQAFDYLLKPIFFEDFELMLERYLSNVKTVQAPVIREDAISIANNEGQHLIKHSDIEYLEAGGAYCVFYLKTKEKHVVSKPLKYYENQLLATNFFFRCHKSYLINLTCISKVMYGEHLINLSSGKSLPLARTQKKLLKSLIEQSPQK